MKIINMKMIKSICIVALLFLLFTSGSMEIFKSNENGTVSKLNDLFDISAVSNAIYGDHPYMGLPIDTVVIGSKAFSIPALMKTDTKEIQTALDASDNKLYYSLDGVTDGFVSLNGKIPITVSQKEDLGKITYIDYDKSANKFTTTYYLDFDTIESIVGGLYDADGKPIFGGIYEQNGDPITIIDGKLYDIYGNEIIGVIYNNEGNKIIGGLYDSNGLLIPGCVFYDINGKPILGGIFDKDGMPISIYF